MGRQKIGPGLLDTLSPSSIEDVKLQDRASAVWRVYRERLTNLALSQFEWKGLPSSIDRRFLESLLLTQGTAAIYVPEGTNVWVVSRWIIGPVQEGLPFDIYGYPKNIIGVDFNGIQRRVTPMTNGVFPVRNKDFFLIWDNQSWLPGTGNRNTLMPIINFYAQQLYEVHETMRINLRHQNTPYLAVTNKKNLLSVRNFFNKLKAFDPVIEVNEPVNMAGNPQQFNVFQTGVPWNGESLLAVRDKLWYDALSVLGISGVTTKQERLITGELSMNRMEPLLSLNSRLLERMEFCNKFNETFGTAITCNFAPTAAQELALLEMDYAAVSGQPGEEVNAEVIERE